MSQKSENKVNQTQANIALRHARTHIMCAQDMGKKLNQPEFAQRMSTVLDLLRGVALDVVGE